MCLLEFIFIPVGFTELSIKFSSKSVESSIVGCNLNFHYDRLLKVEWLPWVKAMIEASCVGLNMFRESVASRLSFAVRKSLIGLASS